MEHKSKIYIVGSGMVTAVGGDTITTAAAVRAGGNSYQESSFYNKHRNPIKMASVPNRALPPLNEALISLPGITAYYQQMLRLADFPLRQSLTAYPLEEPIPLFLSSSELSPGSTETLSAEFLDCLIRQTGVTLDLQNSRLLATGRAGGLQAIDVAFKYFQATDKDFALVGGINTYHGRLSLLSTLDMEDRLLANGVMDGFVPGEAAGFLLLASERALAKYGVQSHLCVYPPGLANESGHRYMSRYLSPQINYYAANFLVSLLAPPIFLPGFNNTSSCQRQFLTRPAQRAGCFAFAFS